MGFGERLEALRRERGLSQAEVAEIAGVHPVQMSRYETGKGMPSVEVVKGLAVALAVSTDELLFDPGERKLSKDAQLLFEAVSTLDKKRKDAVKTLIEAAVLASHDEARKADRAGPPPGRPRSKKK